MGLKLDQQKLDRKIEYLKDTMEVKSKVKISISNILHDRKLSEAKKECRLKNKFSYLERVEKDEIFILKEIESQAKNINKKHSKNQL
jgi:hypothetical protein